MRQVARILSTYTADVSGVCSALYELGGMVVMHDPSGCNSTYNTHDELRWYDQDSLIFISGLSELDAILGSEDKLIADVVSAAEQLSPKFIAIAGTPIPMMSGVDFDAVARVVEAQTGLPTFGFATNGMHSYVQGAGMALAAVARRLTRTDVPKVPRGVNVLGATPLDFALTGTEQSVQTWLTGHGFSVLSCWAMGSTLDQLAQAGGAAVNLVISSTGFAPAQALYEKFGTPYVVGLPIGPFGDVVLQALETALQTGTSQFPSLDRPRNVAPAVTLIGEAVTTASLASALWLERGISAQVLCPLETPQPVLELVDLWEPSEEGIEKALENAKAVAADPLFRPIVPAGCPFYPLPHVAFSGRIYAKQVPDWTKLLDQFPT